MSTFKPPAFFSGLIKSGAIKTAEIMRNTKKEIRPTGSVSLDWALGGGIPKGELVMFWGPPGAMKTTLALKMVAAELAKNPDGYAIWLDTEYAFDLNRAVALGIPEERILVFPGNTMEQAIKTLAQKEEEIKEDKRCCCIVLDSIKALTSINEQNQMADGKVESAASAFGGIAKSVNPSINLLIRLASECNILTIITNHASMNLDPMKSKFYPWVLTGGQKLKHMCSTVIFLERPDNKKSKLVDEGTIDIQGKEIIVGSVVRAKINKSRLTVEGKNAEFTVNMETGEFGDQSEELANLALALGVLYHPADAPRSVGFGPEKTGIRTKSLGEFIILLQKDKNLSAKVLAGCKEVKFDKSLKVNAGPGGAKADIEED